ncbi:AAA family ATPase [Pseudoalteromonas sp. K222D]|uniref:AAA family ATPase n=1 Tax=Pseudoalteromonas sp. K222D TaxID=2820756 RepID=UPI001AD719AD|nr:AAA family ATPase [Pseudoalteromonas sp. K222D]MBO7925328.1 AAA family ATPase [Pseudoalteromonas sp. K222D]
MLKRISTIKNIGTYKDCNGRQSQFEKLTLVYGRNTYGKSTLGDIFSSLKSGESASLIARKSIPDDGLAQKVELNFLDADGKKEVKAIFNNDDWKNKLPGHLRLAVYDDAFYHQNVFLGRTLTRDTKESFSDFILGSQGVVKAENIAAKNKELKDKRSELKKLNQSEFSKVDDLKSFIAEPLVADIDTTKEELDKKREEYALLNSQKKASKAIRERKNLFPLKLATEFSEAVVAINTVLKTGLENPHEAAKAELNRHIEKHFIKPEGAEQWIKQGLSLLDGDNCHFCGQIITPQANELLDLYRQCFDDQFARHESFVKTTIKRHQNLLSAHWLEKLDSSIDSASLIIDNYPELSNDHEIPDTVNNIKISHEAIQRKIEQIILIVNQITEAFATKIDAKLADPKSEFEVVVTAEFDQQLHDLSNNINDLNAFYLTFNKRANEFKAKFEVDQIEKDLERLAQQGKDVALKVERYEKNNACKEHIALSKSICALEDDIPKLKESLRNEQSTFLELYFTKINKHFNDLGSRDFKLKYKAEPLGNKPIYSFKVKFKGTDIAEADLDKIFSESDRRSLGLSIFLASIDSLEEEALAKTIVVFDDPVTSFDENRVGQTHSKLVKLADKCQQIIMLSHFKDGVANFLKVHGFSKNDIALIEIKKNAQGSYLEVGNKDAFVKSAHHLNTEELIDFVERNTDKLSCKPRVYLEEVLSLRFSKQIQIKQITNESLSKRIDALSEKKIVSKGIAEQLHGWREELNPEHHVWVDDDIENQRTTIASFLEFVFYDLVAEPVGEV